MASKGLRILACVAGVLVATVALYAAASYPSSVKSFSTKLAGATISASHINDLQDEVVAIEGGLLNGIAHTLKPSSAGGQNLGTAGVPWGTLFVNTISGPASDFARCNLRATLTTATPITTADVTAATTVYVTPVLDGQCGFYDGASTWTVLTNAEATVTVPSTTSTMYDLFCYNNSGTIACEALAWSSDTSRATALAKQNNIYVKTGATTRRYIASFRTTTVSGQTEDSIAKRYVWNYYHRVDRVCRVIDATASWPYTTNTLRQARATATNQLDVVIGVSEDPVSAAVVANATDTTSGTFLVGIGLDSTTANATGVTAGMATFSAGAAIYAVSAQVTLYPGVGRHTLVWLEAVVSGTSATWFGADKYQTGISSGIRGTVKG